MKTDEGTRAIEDLKQFFKTGVIHWVLNGLTQKTSKYIIGTIFDDEILQPPEEEKRLLLFSNYDKPLPRKN